MRDDSEYWLAAVAVLAVLGHEKLAKMERHLTAKDVNKDTALGWPLLFENTAGWLSCRWSGYDFESERHRCPSEK